MNNQAAITLLKGLEQSLDDYCELNDEGKTAFRMAITALELFGNAEQLPSAQPEKRTEKRTETHSCDSIDRQAAIDALADMHCKSDEDGYVWIIRSDAWARIDALPSVTPKRKCIDAVIPNDNGGLPVQVCDQCNTFFPLAYTGGGHRFCPNCGARMTEEEA